MSLNLRRAGRLFAACDVLRIAGPTLLAMCAVLGVLAAGCGKEPKVDPNRITIAVIPKGTTHEFWKSIHAGAMKAAREMDVDIIWKGPLKEDDREAQIAVVENMVRLGVKGIVLAPLDDTALAAPVAAAAKGGVPVVVIDSGLKSKSYISYVATDNLKGGKLGGERLAKLLKKKGRVVMLRYEEGSASTMLREKGFMAVMKKYPRIKVVSANQYGGATTESAYKASENLLAPHKKDGGLDIDGIFCPNESTTFGMLRALQDAGLAGKVTFVGFDASAKLVQALRKGQIQGLVLQNPVNMGYLGVKTMVTSLKNKELPRSRRRPVRKIIDTGEMLATPENMDDPAVKEILEPNLKEWLK